MTDAELRKEWIKQVEKHGLGAWDVPEYIEAWGKVWEANIRKYEASLRAEME